MRQFLIIRPDRIGDAIVSAVAIEFLALATPCVIDILASSYNYGVYQDNPHIRNIFHCDINNKCELRQYYKQHIAPIQYDAVFILQPRRRLYLAAILSNSAHYFAFKLNLDNRLTSKLSCWYLAKMHNFSYIAHNALQHEVLNLHALIVHGLNKMDVKPALTAQLPGCCRLYNRAIRETNKIPHSIAINLAGKSAEHKNLQPSMLRALVNNLASTVGKIGIVVCTDAEHAIAQQIITEVAQQHGAGEDDSAPVAEISIISNADIWMVANELNSYMYYVGADGGLLHMAAALGLKCVGLYNADAAALWAPWSTQQVTLAAPDAYDIDPEAVLAALARLL